MRTMSEYLKEALDEREVIDDVGDEVRYLKTQLEKMELRYSSGNFKQVKIYINDIIKRLNNIKKGI